MLQKLLDETTKIYERFKGITEEPKEGLPGLLNIDIVAATMIGGVPIRAKEPLQVCGPLEDETSTLRPVRVANMLVVGEESPLRVSHPGPINVATVDNVTSVTEVQGVLEVTSVANVVNVDTVLSVTEVSDVATVGVVTNVMNVADVGVVGEVTNVLSVAEVIDVATVAAVGAVATVASVEEVASVTVVELVAAVTGVALVTEVAHVSGGNSVEVTNFPSIQDVLVRNNLSSAVPVQSSNPNPFHVIVDNNPAQQHVLVDNGVNVANFPSQQHVLVDNQPTQQHVYVDNQPAQQHVIVDGTPHVDVDNWPSQQHVLVDGTPHVDVANWPNQQHVIVDNAPTVNVQGTVNAHIVRNQNDPLNIQPVVLMGPETDGQYWHAMAHTIDYRDPGNAPMQDQYNSQIQNTTVFYSHQNSLHHNHIHMYTDNGGI